MCPGGEILSAYLDDEIGAQWNQRIEEHIKRCKSCQTVLEELLMAKQRLQEDKEPDYRSSLKRFKQSLRDIWLKPLLPKVPFWKRRVALPYPVAAIAAVLILFMATSMIFLSSRSQIRRMSIKKEPSGTTEIQVAAPIEDLEVLLKSLDKQSLKREIIITLPEESKFIIIGEPRMLREAEFFRIQE